MSAASRSTSWCARTATDAARLIRSCWATNPMRALNTKLRALPSVDEVLRTPTALLAVERFGRPASVAAVRVALDGARGALHNGDKEAAGPDHIAAMALDDLNAAARSKLRPVFNLTGTVLHTNLGRA